jgi:hypothetical protein
MIGTENEYTHVLRGRCNSEPAVTVRDPIREPRLVPFGPTDEHGSVDLVQLQDRR